MKSRSKNPSRGKRGGSSRTIRYAVIGLGHIAQVAVLPAFKHAKHSELAALVSGDERKLAELKKKYRVPKTFHYRDFAKCLADPGIDAVYIALPNDLHYDCALRAAVAGKHILCEKPLALSVREGRLMAQVAEDHGVKFMTAYRLHFEPATLEAIKLVRSGKIGEPKFFSSTFSYQLTDPDNIRLKRVRGGGPLYDIGVYCINASRYLMGDEPVEVMAMLARSADKRFREVEESGAVLLRYPGGRLASFVVSFGAAAVARCELVGTKGAIVLDPAYEYSEPLKQELTVGESTREREFPHTDQFAGEIEAFSESILRRRDPEPSAWEGIADLRILEGIFESAETGRAVRLPPFEKAERPTLRQKKVRPPVRPPEPIHVDSPHD
jgi:predicted dehydrogenase